MSTQNAILSTEQVAVQTVHLSDLIIIQSQDEEYFYGLYKDLEYSIDKQNGQISIRKDENTWENIENPFVYLTEDVQKDIVLKNACFNNFMLNQQIINLNLEIARIHSQEIAPLKSALEQANSTIQQFIHSGKSNRKDEGLLYSLQRAQSRVEEQKIYIQKLKEELSMKNLGKNYSDEEFDNEVKKRIQDKCNALAQQIDFLNKQLIEKDSQFNQMKEQFEFKNNEVIQLRDQIQLQNMNFDKITSQLNTKTEEMVELTTNFNRIKESESTNLRKIETYLTDINSLRQKINNLEKKNAELQFSTEKEAELQNLRLRVSQIETEKTQMRSSFASNLDSQIKERTKNIEQNLERLRSQLSEKDRELNKTKQEYKKLLKTFDEVECDYNIMKSASNTIKEECKNELLALNTQVNDKNALIESLKEKNTRVEKQFRKCLEDLQRSKKEAENMEKNYISVVQTFEEENNRLRYDVKSARDKVKLYHEVSNRSVDQLKAVIRREKILKNALNKYEGKPTDDEANEFVGTVVEHIVRNSIESYHKNLETQQEPSQVYAN